MELGLRQMRNVLGLTQYEMGQKVGLHGQTIQKYEACEKRGEPFPINTLLAVKHVYEKEISGANQDNK